MNRRIVFGIMMAVMLLLGALLIGGVAFNAGVTQGIAQSAQVAGSDGGTALRAYGYPFFAPWHFGFGIFGIFAVIFLVFLFFGIMRRIFWFGSMRSRGVHGWAGRWGDDMPAGGVPPMFEEMHRRAHAQETASKSGDSVPKV